MENNYWFTLAWAAILGCVARWMMNASRMGASPEKDKLEDKICAIIILLAFSGLWLFNAA